MIESIIRPSSVQRKPWEAFIAGFLFTIVAAVLTMQIRGDGAGAGMLLVAFINLFRIEETHRKGNLFQRHMKIIEIFGFFFLAVILATSLIYVILPASTSAIMFEDQSDQLMAMGSITGNFGATGHAVQIGSPDEISEGISFGFIAGNNLKVLVLAFIFSFIFGAGAVWLIAWNASVLGVFIGKIAENPTAFGSVLVVKGNIVANYIIALPLTLVRLFPHGIFEFGGFFFGAIAGGILSMTLIQERHKKHKALPAMKDSFYFLLIAVGLIIIGAIIEVTFQPGGFRF